MASGIHVQVTVWKLLAAGLVAGIVGGGLGVGGGIVLVPILLTVGLDRHRAHATSLAAIVLIAVVGVISFGAAGEIEVGVGLTFGLGGIVGSIAGTNAMNRMSPQALSIAFGIILLAAGIRMILGGAPNSSVGTSSAAVQLSVALAVGLVAGFFAGLAGIGGGVINVPAGVFIFGLTQLEAQGTSLAAIVLAAAAGTMTNLRNHRLILREGVAVGLAGAAGSLLGSRIALGSSERVLNLVFGFLIVFVGGRTIYRAAAASL